MFKRTNQEAGQAQATGYLHSLDGWIDEQVTGPLFKAWQFQEHVADDESAEAAEQEVEEARKAVYKAIKDKVLESYRNGQKAGPRAESRSWSGGRGGASHGRQARPYGKDRKEA